MDKTNLASMLKDYEKGIVNASPLSRAIGEQARQEVNAVSQLREGSDIPSNDTFIPGLGNDPRSEWEYATRNINLENAPNLALDAMGVANLIGKGNPYTLAATTARDLYRWNDRFNSQRPMDRIDFGIKSNPVMSAARSAPLGIGYLMRKFGPQPSNKYPFSFKAYLANRGIDFNDYDGTPVVGPPPQAPVTQTLLPAPKGTKAAPWINPNLPRESYNFGDDGSNVTDQASFDDFASDVGFGVFNKGGIASLSA